MRRAFTLVELTLCIAIIVVLSAIAMPRYARAIAAYRVKCAAQRIVVDLAQAQSNARASSTARTISFNVSSSSYQIANVRALNSAATTYQVSLSDDLYKTTISTLSLNSSQIVFDGFGYPDGGGTITLQSGDTTKTVVIDPTSGKASVQ